METLAVVLPRPRTHAASAVAAAPSTAPASGLLLQQSVSMTAGAEEPLAALAAAPVAAVVVCHPCDEAIVRHLMAHVGRRDIGLLVDGTAAPGALGLSVRFAVAS